MLVLVFVVGVGVGVVGVGVGVGVGAVVVVAGPTTRVSGGLRLLGLRLHEGWWFGFAGNIHPHGLRRLVRCLRL